MPKLCDWCSIAFKPPNDPYRKLHYDSYQSLLAAVAFGCYFCTRIRQVLKDYGMKDDSDWGGGVSLGYAIEADQFEAHQVLAPQIYWNHKFPHLRFFLWPQDPSHDHGFQVQHPRDGFVQVRHKLYKEIPGNTGASEVGFLAHSWLQTCLKVHRDCTPISPNRSNPPRLLDISHMNPRLVQVKPNSHCPSYAALSHVWGINPDFLTLTTSKKEEWMKKGIPEHRMPQNFRDAIRICHWLKIRYLWIDSLCIIQSGDESAQDWLDHVGLMAGIYEGSQVCISASCASKAAETCFNDRDPEAIPPLSLEIATDEFDPRKLRRYILVPDDLHLRGHRGTPLSFRGWALQERLLARRVLTVGPTELFWQCCNARTKNVCESFPEGSPFDLAGYTSFVIPSPTRTRTITKDTIEFWRTLIETYSRCSLTRADEDKFAAFAGLALKMRDAFGDACDDAEYIAGFFRHELPQALLWGVPYRHKPVRRLHTSGTYRAPSWSWAATDARVEMPSFDARNEIAWPDGKLKLLATIQNHSIQPVKFGLGPLKYAELVLKAPLFSVTWEKEMTNASTGKADVRMLVADAVVVYPVHFDNEEDEKVDQNGAAFLAIQDVSTAKFKHYRGLIVKKVEGGVSDQCERYRRLGMCRVTSGVLNLVELGEVKEVVLV